MRPSRFLFDTDFTPGAAEREDAPPPVPEIPMMPVAEHEARLAAAEKQAFEKGRAAGRTEGSQSAETKLSSEVGRLASEVAGLLGELDTHGQRREKDAIALAFLVARRLSAHLIAREPLGEMVALIAECMGPLRKAPHLVIRVREGDVEALRERLEPITHEKGFEGRLVILGEPDIERGDCRIEWADGGIVRDRKEIERQIDQAARRYLGSRRQAEAETPNEE
ncbi:FliH/SctL family protein [Stappia albiluteola]|nr:FliH/SctL family protein [Stappia albiluteola]